MIRDPQNVVTISGNRMQVRGRNVAFYYHHDSSGRMKQCNVFSFLTLLDGTKYLIMSYSRPHILDKSKVSKVTGRTIAAARLAKFFDLADAGDIEKIKNMKGIRVYLRGEPKIFTSQWKLDENGNLVTSTYPGYSWQLESYRKSLPRSDGKESAARCEKISDLLLSRISEKL